MALIASVTLWRFLRTRQASSELVGAEASQWAAGWILSAGIVVGFGTGQLLQQGQWRSAAAYVDLGM